MKLERPKSKQPLPPHAKKVFQGKIFSVWQWEQKLFNNTFKTFEKVQRGDSVNVWPVNGRRKIILTKQSQPGHKDFIGSVGGVVDLGERPLEAAKRELLEESGLVAGSFEPWFSVQPLTLIDWGIYTFIAKDLKKVSDLKLDTGEKIELIEVSSEIALKVLKSRENPLEFEKIRKLFS